MLPWWGWVLLWAVLVLGGALLLLVLGRRTWGRFRALTAEVGRLERLSAAVEAEVATPNLAPPPPPRLDVFTPVHEVRVARDRTRTTLREARRARRAERLPGWARSVDSTTDAAAGRDDNGRHSSHG